MQPLLRPGVALDTSRSERDTGVHPYLAGVLVRPTVDQENTRIVALARRENLIHVLHEAGFP